MSNAERQKRYRVRRQKMETGRFMIKAASDKILVNMVVAVKSTEACMDSRITETQNKFWDVLRTLGFNANKIVLETNISDDDYWPEI